jgi:hypothetical protein
MKIIQGDLILKKDTTFHEPLKVEGNILGKDGKRFSLTVHGNITAKDITAWNIYARNIDALDINTSDITAWNIYAGDVNAKDINAWDIICETRKKKDQDNKTIARTFVTEKSKLERKNWEFEA